MGKGLGEYEKRHFDQGTMFVAAKNKLQELVDNGFLPQGECDNAISHLEQIKEHHEAGGTLEEIKIGTVAYDLIKTLKAKFISN